MEHGVFATRAPCRPNPIGFSIVRLLSRRGNLLEVDGVDILDGTPLLDVKPYIGRFDRIEGTRDGWQEAVDEETARRRGSRNFVSPAESSEKDRSGCRPSFWLSLRARGEPARPPWPSTWQARGALRCNFWIAM